MSSIIRKYKIHYDGNDGYTYDKDLYCKYDNSSDIQQWRYSDGRPIDFRVMTDSQAEVTACCIAQIPTNDKYFYWEQFDNDIPNIVKNSFI